jgi:hypothetical protein
VSPSRLVPLLPASRIRAGCSLRLLLGAALGVLVLLASPADAQGLGDAAAREQTKRRTEPNEAKAKVFTNDDLASEEKPAEETGEASSSDEEAVASKGEPARADGESDEEWRERTDREREKRVLQEREWRARFTEARAKVREEEAKCWQEVVRTEFHQGIPVQMKVKEFVESEAYRQARKDLADLQEEFRRTGLPPGWARE